MSSSRLDPLRLDVAGFAAKASHLEGTWPLASLSRLADLHLEAPAQAIAREVVWSATGEERVVSGAPSEVWMHLDARCALAMLCQRCLSQVEVLTEVKRWLRFAGDEAEAAELDAESEDDVLPLQRWLNLKDLVEDELLLALPLVPRHEQCPEAPSLVHEAENFEEPEHPFAALQRLRRPPTS